MGTAWKFYHGILYAHDQNNKTLERSLLFDSLKISSMPIEYSMQSCLVWKNCQWFDCERNQQSSKCNTEITPSSGVWQHPHPNQPYRDPYPSGCTLLSSHARHCQTFKCLVLHEDITSYRKRPPGGTSYKWQRIGPLNAPFGQFSPLGWTIIGDVCLSG